MGVVVAVATLGVSVVPSTAQGSVPAAQLNSIHTVPETDIPSVGMFVPPMVFGSGDDEFAGHGPDIATSATLRIGVGSPRNLHVFLCMIAEETREDFSRVGGCEFFLIFQASAGECVDEVLLDEIQPLGMTDELKYRDTNHDPEEFPGQVHTSFVKRWGVVGDTLGPEAGKLTGTKILTHRFLVRTSTGDRCR